MKEPRFLALALLRVLQRDLATLQGPDHWCNAHLTEDLRDAIHLPVPGYLIPETLAAWQEAGSLHGATVTLTTSGAAIVRLPPADGDQVKTRGAAFTLNITKENDILRIG